MMRHQISSEASSEPPEPRVSVVLTGSESDIRKLADYYSDMANGWIRKHSDSWILSSSALDHATDVADAIRMARDTIEHQNSAMFLTHEYSGVCVSNQVLFVDSDKTTIHLMMCDTASLTVPEVFICSNLEPTIDPHVFAKLAKNDDRISLLSAHLPKLHGDWHDLYAFAEAVGSIIPGAGGGSGLRKLKRAAVLSWISKREIKDFARAANAARHPGSSQQQRLMSVSAGRRLMTTLAHELLSNVQGECHATKDDGTCV